ncbi:MAG: DNA-protecting protein DprA [Candidatus Omnitrophica bacterium]|nr:DNA-protecting protein DprA [Candidatus Omnitrophota bacterium]
MNNIVKFGDARYPRLLKEIDSPPKKLYYKGNWDSSIFKNCLAVVGSRRMTTYGKLITSKLVSEVAMAGVTVVSGFMFGIDATAHKAAIDVGGRTIAVMPCGIDIIHPEHQEDLYKEILESNGLILSEFANTFPVALWTYPKRNRIVAGLSCATMVVEAGEKSGSLITAGFAKKYKRRLLAVPGPLTSASSKGTAQLIKQGADIVTSAEDVLVGYDIIVGAGLVPARSNGRPQGLPLQGLNELEKNILKRLQEEPMEIDVLMRSVGAGLASARRNGRPQGSPLHISEIGTALSLMQLKGLIFEERGKYHITI